MHMGLVFRCKHYPDGSIHKLKAWLCVRGDKQVQGIDYFENYAPVVQWTTIHHTLIVSMLLNWESEQTYYTNAFA